MGLDLQSVIEKLNPVCRKGLEFAAEFCVSHGNYNVELEHFLLKLLDAADTDIQRLFRYYEIRTGDVQRELTRIIERFKRGNSRTPSLSPQIIELLEQAWLLSSLHFDSGEIRSGAILTALLDHDVLRGVIIESSPSLKKIPKSAIKKEFREIIKHSSEDAGAPGSSKADSDKKLNVAKDKKESQQPSLEQFTIDLTDRARRGEIDPIYGRDLEIRQIIDILTRRRQNNPILTGDAGVGKTAVVEGFAIRIAEKKVPKSLQKISLRLLDLGLLQAGAGIKGEFEKRLKSVIDEVKAAPNPIILFIDEAHMMIGAGGAAGQGDAANLLKPALARGELRTIAATTWSEYKKYFEKDPALARRFQVVKIDEPSEESAIDMVRGVVENLELHHNVTILDEAVRDAVRLSSRYITGRQLPDKAINVLDTACARVSIGQNGIPVEIEDVQRRMDEATLELKILEREQASGSDHIGRVDELRNLLKEINAENDELEAKWKIELKTVVKFINIQKKIIAARQNGEQNEDQKDRTVDVASLDELVLALKKEEDVLKSIQEDETMVPVCVDSRIIASVISDWTGIPVGKMMTDEIDTVLNLKAKMEERIIGQSQALETISKRIRTYRADLDDPGKPVGVFLMSGPSGVGKTETAVTLAEILYGGERNLISINMSEYQEAYTVSGLKGSPPGYVGYGKGGVLTEAVRQKPYSIVLLDEVEKAHPDVMELFYQVFDKGVMEDSEGLVVDFKNTIILLTSNVGSDRILKATRMSSEPLEYEYLQELIRPDLLDFFKPSFLGRLVIVPFYPLDDEVIRTIVQLKLGRVINRFEANHRIKLHCTDEIVAAIAERCTEVDTGARNVDYILTHALLPDLSSELLQRMGMGAPCTDIFVSIDEMSGFEYRFEPSLASEEEEEKSHEPDEQKTDENDTNASGVDFSKIKKGKTASKKSKGLKEFFKK